MVKRGWVLRHWWNNGTHILSFEKLKCEGGTGEAGPERSPCQSPGYPVLSGPFWWGWSQVGCFGVSAFVCKYEALNVYKHA